jgi:hypothetical protein
MGALPLRFRSSHSVLGEQRSRGPAWRDFATAYAAADITPAHLPVAAVARFGVAGAPLLYFTPDATAAVVDARYLGRLAAVDATALSPGDVAVIGEVTPAGRAALAPALLAEFLMAADVVRTYAHLESEVRLEGRDDADGGWTGRVTGEHVFFTHDEHRAALAFDLVLAPDGTLTAVGR